MQDFILEIQRLKHLSGSFIEIEISFLTWHAVRAFSALFVIVVLVLSKVNV